MEMTSKDLKYINDVLRFTERQIKLNTGHDVVLSAEGMEQNIFTPELIFEIVSDALKINAATIRGADRRRDAVIARQIICYLVKRHLPKVRDVKVGDMLNKERTLFIYSIKQVDDLLSSQDPYFMGKYATVLTAMENYKKEQHAA